MAASTALDRKGRPLVPRMLSDEDIAAFRERLCDVAERLFVSHGPEGVTIRQLAKALGVSSMTPYRYFADKDAILAAVRMRAFDRFSAAMERAMSAEDAGATPPGEVYLAFARANPSAYRMMFDVYQPTYEIYPDLVAAMARARATMAHTLRWRQPHAMAHAMTQGGDPNLVAHMFWSALHGAVMLELAGLLGPPMSARAIVEPTLKALSAQLSRPQGPS